MANRTLTQSLYSEVMYYFCSFLLAKASHTAKSDVSVSGKYNPPFRWSFKYLGTITQLTTTPSYTTGFQSMIYSLANK